MSDDADRARAALEAMPSGVVGFTFLQWAANHVQTIRAALEAMAQPAQPVLWVRMKHGEVHWDENCVAPTRDALEFYEEDEESAMPLYAAPPAGQEQRPAMGLNERERLERKAEGYRDRALHLEHLEAVALRYRDSWLICHENNPRPPEEGELIRLGHLRGLLFAAALRGSDKPAVDSLAAAQPATQQQTGEGEK